MVDWGSAWASEVIQILVLLGMGLALARLVLASSVYVVKSM